jgi:hypothetical protein
MNLGILEDMEAPELREYLRFLLWHYRVVDGFWFMSVEKQYGREIAEHLVKTVWGKIAGMSAEDLVKRFNIQEKGIKGLVKAFQFFPWTILVGYHITKTGDNEAFVTVPECPAQMARVKLGLPEFHCRDMHRADFESFSHAIDPRIKVECLFCPPDHPPDLFCKWRFSLSSPVTT